MRQEPYSRKLARVIIQGSQQDTELKAMCQRVTFQAAEKIAQGWAPEAAERYRKQLVDSIANGICYEHIGACPVCRQTFYRDRRRLIEGTGKYLAELTA